MKNQLKEVFLKIFFGSCSEFHVHIYAWLKPLFYWTWLLCRLFLVLTRDLGWPCFKALCVWYFSSYSLHTNFSHISIFILLGENGRSLRSWCSTLWYLISLSSMYPLPLSSSQSYVNSSLDLNKSLVYSKSSTRNFCEITHPYKLLTFRYIRYEDSLLGS